LFKEVIQEKQKADLTWKGGVCSEIKMRNHTIIIDSKKDDGGEDLGPEATEVFLATLGACVMTNISRIGKKMRLNIKNVSMEINGVKEHNGHPSSFVALDINVSIEADTNDREKLERLVELSEKNCTVSNTVKNAVATKIKLQLI
jgi:putative redox protein